MEPTSGRLLDALLRAIFCNRSAMKFGKDLQQNIREIWRAHYLDYQGLKDVLEICAAKKDLTDFESMRDHELEKVNLFYLGKVQEFSQVLDVVDQFESKGTGPQVIKPAALTLSPMSPAMKAPVSAAFSR
jgi:hypothetical protein